MELNLSNMNWCKNEIDSLRAQLAEVTRELKVLSDFCEGAEDRSLLHKGGLKCLVDAVQKQSDNYARALAAGSKRIAENHQIEQQLLATQAHAARLARAINVAAEKFHDYAELHSLKEQTPENQEKVEQNLLLSRMCDEALSTPINLDALHEDRARTLEEAAKNWIYGSTFNVLNEMAAAHRAKKEGK